MEKKNYAVLCGLFLLLPFSSNAHAAASSADADESNIEVVVVTGVKSRDTLKFDSSEVTQPGVDNSDLLRQFPGGNRNVNGAVTRISQYRGLFGAQNNISIDGLAHTSGGPNWMDSPLSSIPQSLTQSVTLYRGLGLVADIQEGLGGSIAIESRQAGFSQGDQWNNYGLLEAGYGANVESWGAAVYTGVRTRNNWFDVAASLDKGNDYEFAGGTVAASEYDRDQYRLGYGHRFEEANQEILNSDFQNFDLGILSGLLQMGEHQDPGLWAETLTAIELEYDTTAPRTQRWEANIASCDYAAANA